jgi:hypothetical protein
LREYTPRVQEFLFVANMAAAITRLEVIVELVSTNCPEAVAGVMVTLNVAVIVPERETSPICTAEAKPVREKSSTNIAVNFFMNHPI